MNPVHKSPPPLTPGIFPTFRETGHIIVQAGSPAPHLGWYSRGFLPHWDHPNLIQSLNFRLADSLPQDVVEKWQNELALTSLPNSQRATALRRRIERFLDAGHGECWLGRPEFAQLVEGALLHFDGERYRLLGWCIIPNHVHALIETWAGFPLSAVMHSWKSFTGRKANHRLSRCGDFWQREYLDRYVRTAEHYQAVVNYMEENPIKARLVKLKAEWPWSSARFRRA